MLARVRARACAGMHACVRACVGGVEYGEKLTELSTRVADIQCDWVEDREDLASCARKVGRAAVHRSPMQNSCACRPNAVANVPCSRRSTAVIICYSAHRP